MNKHGFYYCIFWSLKLWFDIFGGNVVIGPRQEALPGSRSSNIGLCLQSRKKECFPSVPIIATQHGTLWDSQNQEYCPPSSLLRPWNQVSKCQGCHSEKLLGSLFRFLDPSIRHSPGLPGQTVNLDAVSWERSLKSNIIISHVCQTYCFLFNPGNQLLL